MGKFIPVTKSVSEAIGYSALDLAGNITPGKVAASVAAGGVGAVLIHDDNHPVLSSLGGYTLGNGLVTAGMIIHGAGKYLK